MYNHVVQFLFFFLVDVTNSLYAVHFPYQLPGAGMELPAAWSSMLNLTLYFAIVANAVL